jgi:hypothetical protein
MQFKIINHSGKSPDNNDEIMSCYKLEGHMFEPRWSHWIFQLALSFQPHYGLGVDSDSKRNEYQAPSL